MTMNRKTTIREIGRRTRLKNRDVQLMLETLIEVWTEELVKGGRVEIENFAVLATVQRTIRSRSTAQAEPRTFRRLVCRPSRTLKSLLNR